MSRWFVMALIIGVIALIATFVWIGANRSIRSEAAARARKVRPGHASYEEFPGKKTDAEKIRPIIKIATLALWAFTAMFLVLSSFNIVPTRSVGVAVSFGKPDSVPLTNGGHLVAPWKSVEIFDASLQTLKLENKGTDAPEDDIETCATVRLGNQTTACVNAITQWNIDPKGDVVELYGKYKDFDTIEDKLVKTQLQTALNEVFEGYDPLSSITDTSTGQIKTQANLAQDALLRLQAKVGDGIKVHNLNLPFVVYDAATQAKLNNYAQALADTRIAEQNAKTAVKTREANEALKSTSTNDPGVQYQNCLNLVKDLAAKGQLQHLPPTFNCNNNAGSAGTPVIVNPSR